MSVRAASAARPFGSLVLAIAGLMFAAAPAVSAEPVGVYVGTYTGGGSEGIYRFEFDTETGTPSGLRLVAESNNPSFLALAPDGKHLYAVNEVDRFMNQPGGGVSAYAIDPSTGKLTLIGARLSRGGSPCHLIVDHSGKNVLVANYGTGSTAVLPIADGGKLESASSFIQHKGSGAKPDRQKGPHAHSVNLDKDGRFAFVADLGLDKVFIYKYEPGTGTITPNDPPDVTLPPGTGPRHFAFHPSMKYAYVIDELNSTMTALSYDAARGKLAPIQTLSTLPSSFRGTNHPADVHVHPNGLFLYGSNRGQNSIVVYTIDPATGRLTYVENQGEGIKNPRNFTIDPTGKFLLVASLDANTISVFTIDPKTGALKPTGKSIDAPKPVCLQFLTPAK